MAMFGRRVMVTELAKPFNMSLHAFSKHLFVLERASPVTRSVAGPVRYCTLANTTIAQASNWLLTYQEFGYPAHVDMSFHPQHVLYVGMK